MESAVAICNGVPLAGCVSCTACRAMAAVRNNSSACGRKVRPASETTKPPREREKSFTASESSKALIRALTAGWLMRRASAARWKPPKVATARKVSTWSISTMALRRVSASNNILLSQVLWLITIVYQPDRKVPFDRPRYVLHNPHRVSGGLECCRRNWGRAESQGRSTKDDKVWQ